MTDEYPVTDADSERPDQLVALRELGREPLCCVALDDGDEVVARAGMQTSV